MPAPRIAAIARRALASIVLLGLAAGAAFALRAWKHNHLAAAASAAANQPEPSEVIEAAPAKKQSYARATTSVGTARALRSITLRNELAGTVRQVALRAGEIAHEGAVLVELDVAVEVAELDALEAEARLAESMLARMEQARKSQGASAADVDRARAEHDKALANVARTKALIERKRVRAPFTARVGMVDLHVGQYLEPGTTITTLQGVDDAVHIDFAVTQEAAAVLHLGGAVELTFAGRPAPAQAKIVAVDARVDVTTRNTWLRALLDTPPLPQPGASVRVRVPIEPAHDVVVVPVSALRRGPSGDHVFVLAPGPDGSTRGATRRVASGALLGDDVIVRDGVQAGELIATTGSFKLRDGVLVQIADEKHKATNGKSH